MRMGHFEISGGFFLLLAWLNYLDRQNIIPLTVMACALHELGHYLVIHWCGITIKQIRLTVIGAEMTLFSPMGYRQECLAALAGPAVNLMLAGLCCWWEPGVLFAGINLALALLNLLPVTGLDGGRAIYCVLSLLAGPDAAGRVGEWLNFICSGALLGISLLLLRVGGNVTLLLVSLWLVLQGNNYRKGQK